MVKMWTRGRLGNVLFQLSAAYAYSLDHGMEFTLNDNTSDPVMQPLYFQNLVNPNWDEKKPSKWIREMQHNFAPIPWEDEWKDYNIQFITGYYQSEKYFKHKRKEIIDLLAIPKIYEKDCWQFVSIHVRRTDYLTIPGKHIDNTGEFMSKAIRHFQELNHNRFLVFSDDIAYCREYFPANFNAEFSFSEGNGPLADLSLMRTCRHHINSSSTFSWWGAWLNEKPDKIILTPREWFQSSQTENTEDIVPENWIRL